VDVLLVHGASALVRTPAQDTALHFAALKGANDILQMLIAAGADVNAVGDVHNRPLHLAAAAEQLEAVHLLLVAGADVRVINCYGHTPLALACKGSRVRQCLLQAEEGGPAEAQRLKQTLQLQHLQSRAARDATQRAAQEE
jgi:ankyrin repeat protein